MHLAINIELKNKLGGCYERYLLSLKYVFYIRLYKKIKNDIATGRFEINIEF